MIFEPRLILMDEPLSALDKQLREVHADRAARAAQADRRHHHLRHARPARGADDERPRRHPEGRQAGPDRPAGAPARSILRIPSSQASSARRACCRSAVSTPHSVALGPAILRSARAMPTGEALMLAVHSEKLLIDDGGCDASLQPPDRHRHRYRLPGRKPAHFSGAAGRHTPQPSPAQPSRGLSRRIPPLGGSLTVTLHPEDTIIVPKAGE